jgi:hypothetical protein
LIALIIDAHRSAAVVRLSRAGSPDIGLDQKDQFASNTPEDAAVLQTSTD